MTKQVCVIYFVRHGESEHNSAGLISGHVNPRLTPIGKKQVLATREDFKKLGIKFDDVYASPMTRAVQTAELITGQAVPKDHQIEELKERTFGELDGKPEHHLNPFRNKHDRMSHEEAWVYKYVPDMESDHEVSLRVTKALERLAKRNMGKTLLIAGHGGAIRTTIMRLTGKTNNELPPGTVKNASFIKLAYDGNQLSVD